MEFISESLTGLAPYMPFISFSLLMLSGLNFPVSEDLVFILSAAIGATFVPHLLPYIYIGCLSGAYLSDLIAYSIGRFAGRKLFSSALLRKFIPEDRVLRMEEYFARYGAKTVLFGRFIPFGARNVIFITAGFSRMYLSRFLIADIIPLSITSTLLFYLGYRFGENYRLILPYLDRYKLVILALFAVFLLAGLIKRYRDKKKGLPAD
jgi:membrane protein DedA with SNARE-associated domain